MEMSYVLKKQIKKNIIGKKDSLYYFIISIGVFAFLLFAGEEFCAIYKDSQAYLTYTKRIGVMPFYQIFLQMNRRIWGESIFLYAAVIEQTLFATVCCVAFYRFLCNYFQLKKLEALPLLVAVITPLTINLPRSMINREIMTEAFSYPLFYIFMIFVIRAVSEKTKRMFVGVCVCSCLMAMIRTQMQLTFCIAAAVWFYIRWRKYDGQRFFDKCRKGIGTVCQCVGIVIVLLVVLLCINWAGQTVISLTAPEKEQRKVSVSADHNSDNVTNQYGNLLEDKSLYEMDYEDYLLFEDEDVRQLYLAVFEQAERKQSRYAYARKGLWKWQDLMNGIAGGTAVLGDGINAYQAAYPDSTLDYNKAVNEICIRLLRAHWPRILYHVLCMIPVGTLCTVFFQIEEIYLACHIFAFGAYFFAALLTIFWYRQGREIPRYWESMMACIAVNWIWILVMCLLFFGMQRYMIYGFGPFWSLVYILSLKLLQRWLLQRRIKKGQGV